MPTSPNSLTITATRRPCSAVRMRLSSVVLPDPRNPLRMTTDALGLAGLVCTVMSAKMASQDVPCKARERTCAGLEPRHVRRLFASVDDRGLHLAEHLADRFPVLHLHVAANDGVDRQALDLPAAPRRGVILAVQLSGIDRRFLVHVDDRQVAVGAEPDRALLRIHLPHP